MPKIFGTQNANGTPAPAVWLTTLVVQFLVISTYFSRDAFSLMLNLTSAMSLIPYLFVAAYGLMIALRGETYDVRPQERKRDTVQNHKSRESIAQVELEVQAPAPVDEAQRQAYRDLGRAFGE